MKRNILFITADQLRHDCLGFRGRFPVRTPHLDTLAAKGTVFEQAYCASPICVPSRASIMTGRYPCRTGVYYNDQRWDEHLATLPGELAKNGYYTVAVGKMHFVPKRRHAGFSKMLNETELGDYFRRKPGKSAAGAPAPKVAKSWDEAIVEHYQRRWKGDREIAEYEPFFHTSNAIKELEKLVLRRDCTGEAHEPFFMWLSMLRPHSPCCPPPPFSDWYRAGDIFPPVKTLEEKAAFAKPLRDFAKGWEALSDEVIADFRARYLGEVSVVDHQVGRILEALEQLGLRENTLIVFSSDHGDYLGDHHLQQKAFFHDASSRVPLIFQGPEVQAGHRVKENVSLIDLLPTLLDYGQFLPPRMDDEDGQPLYPCDIVDEDALSLLPALGGGSLDPERIVVAETGIYGQGIMAKVGHLKYNYYPQTQEFDLFDLASDPDELRNLGASVRFDTLPAGVRAVFQKVLEHTEPMRCRSYCFEGKIRKMFT